ncbi:ubiquinone biosynthesis UbiH/UbiF/VisC/COQ6 family hydroxylase [Acidovorax sp. 62]|uniref:5-demethoxyubiquinol-8 5-hydroxylase UbiM n=1 Tax=Acidovorax sp. 62 TaxID=2035203 RepID=UPI000C575A63|nr:5-demethoxyubiquinol-8 5-hydroxylase UbiM [Acidovorax sp. 62]PIF92782.1 ubiquinone biosynthesis UbiH/UbiF/VisC/COQ6 family hydroxylase [Acidovorax sp. 62]
MHMHSDVLIVGAGPAGLSLAISLAQAGFTATVLDQNPTAALEQPAPDGREIALTHPSAATLQRLGTWGALASHEIGHIRTAEVHDGPVGAHSAMQLQAPDGFGSADTPAGTTASGPRPPLGFIVPNHALRRTAYQVAARTPGVRIVAGAQVHRVAALATHAEVDFALTAQPGQPSERLCAPLVVAADSRFSAARRQLGIGAQMTDFGRTVIVCRMRHAEPHGDTAHECFGYERTLAVLPLPDVAAGATDGATEGQAQCSVVVTAQAADAARMLALEPAAFTAEVQAQFQNRLGAMELLGERHAYPLVAVYAQRFTGPRCALLGDAAVGMHPVTAHGYNLGLAGVERLTQALVAARQRGQDWGDAAALAPYARAHHLHAWPIYQGTNAIVRLYTDARPLPRALRQLVLQGARRLPPLKAAIVAQLTGKAPRWQAPLAQLGNALAVARQRG